MEQFSECIIGKWSESPDQIERLFTDTSMARLPGFSAHATGEGSVEFRRDGTYTYAPAFAVEIRFIGQSGTGQWGGTLEGTWSVEGSTLTMAQTNNQLTGSLRVMGSEQPMPRLKTFDGTGKVDACTPATFTYEITTPIGAVAHTLVNVG